MITFFTGLLDLLAPVLFGWPFILLTILATLAGILSKRAAWVILGAFIATPFAFYLGATPRFGLAGLFLPLLHLAAAYAVYRERRWLAVLLLLPYAGIVVWLAWAVLTQPSTA